MCRTTAYKSTTCQHRWLTITTRCSPGAGFTSTPIHEFRFSEASLFGSPRFQKAPAGTCPNCDMKGQYDGNTTRLLLRKQNLYTGGPLTVLRGGTSIVNGAGMMYSSGYEFPATNIQSLTPYQQQFAANQQVAALARMQHHPEARYSNAIRDKSGCSVM